MKWITEICRGMLIGVANIMPGVSGGTLAVSMGIYDKLIYSVTHMRKNFKGSFKILFPVGVGVVLGFLGLSYVIVWMFSKYPMQTYFLFIGLVFGGIPAILRSIRGEPIKWFYFLVALAFFILIAGISVLKADETMAVMDLSVVMAVKLFGIGFLVAATMVIPGVSGSMILLSIGYYHPLLNEITQCLYGFLTMDLLKMYRGVVLLAPAALGVIVGILLIAKLVEYLFLYHQTISYWAILGLIFASPVGILSGIEKQSVDIVTIFTTLFAFLSGIFLTIWLGEKES